MYIQIVRLEREVINWNLTIFRVMVLVFFVDKKQFMHL